MRKMTTRTKSAPIRVGLVVPHLFIHREIMPQVIFSPGRLALELAEGLAATGLDVTLFTPGPADTVVRNITVDLGYFEQELTARGDSYIDLLKKHPLVFVSLARQAQAELIAKAYAMANAGELDLVHIYTNEEDLALPFAALCSKPVVFTHHDPFSFLVRYKHVFPKYAHLNWISVSLAQRRDMPPDTNWVANIYHGADGEVFRPVERPSGGYFAYMGRIVEPKGVHWAIAAVKEFNRRHPHSPTKLKIAGKHYAGHSKDSYWQDRVRPELGDAIDYVGYLREDEVKSRFLANARALIMPSTFAEPFGLVMAEALACGTPVVGLRSGAIPEVVKNGETGWVVDGQHELAEALGKVDEIDRNKCRVDFEDRFKIEKMVAGHVLAYEKVLSKR